MSSNDEMILLVLFCMAFRISGGKTSLKKYLATTVEPSIHSATMPILANVSFSSKAASVNITRRRSLIQHLRVLGTEVSKNFFAQISSSCIRALICLPDKLPQARALTVFMRRPTARPKVCDSANWSRPRIAAASPSDKAPSARCLSISATICSMRETLFLTLMTPSMDCERSNSTPKATNSLDSSSLFVSLTEYFQPMRSINFSAVRWAWSPPAMTSSSVKSS